MLLGLVEASDNKIGSPVDNILTYCYHYDPHDEQALADRSAGGAAGRHGDSAGLGSFMFVMFRRDMTAQARMPDTKTRTDNG